MKVIPDYSCNPTTLPSRFDRVCAVAFEDNAPPWRSGELWLAAAGTLQYLIYHHRQQLYQVKETAGHIKSLLASIDDPLDRLGGRTCARCSSPCCLVADVSYDFRDLLFLHMTHQTMPPGQPRRVAGDTCRYMGPAGCLIPRFERPWICTWYICAVQKNYLAGHHEISSDHLLPIISDIGMLRKQMENLFITAVAS